MKMLSIPLVFVLSVLASMTTLADGHGDDYPFKKEIQGRMGVMNLYSYYLGELGAMAKGDAPYDAEAASRAANNLLSMAKLDNTTMWPQGSDNSVAALKNKTRAKPEAWTTFPEVAEKHKAFITAATTMAAEAGNGLDAVKANIGAIGKSCKGCHKPFRGPALKGHKH